MIPSPTSSILLTTLLVLMLSACSPFPPWARKLEKGPPSMGDKEYNPLYLQGWQDGCHSGISASTNLWYKFQYGFKQNAELAQDTVYYKGWKDAFDLCQRYTYQYRRRPFI